MHILWGLLKEANVKSKEKGAIIAEKDEKIQGLNDQLIEKDNECFNKIINLLKEIRETGNETHKILNDGKTDKAREDIETILSILRKYHAERKR